MADCLFCNPEREIIARNEAAGQSVWHAHIHVIPRYQGDTQNPRGGVRHVIALKGGD